MTARPCGLRHHEEPVPATVRVRLTWIARAPETGVTRKEVDLCGPCLRDKRREFAETRDELDVLGQIPPT